MFNILLGLLIQGKRKTIKSTNKLSHHTFLWFCSTLNTPISLLTLSELFPLSGSVWIQEVYEALPVGDWGPRPLRSVKAPPGSEAKPRGSSTPQDCGSLQSELVTLPVHSKGNICSVLLTVTIYDNYNLWQYMYQYNLTLWSVKKCASNFDL